MKYEVYVTTKAERQLHEAAKWWAEHRSVEQAESWLDGLVAALNSLENDPERMPLARENDLFPIPVREMLYGLRTKKTHRIVFVVRPDKVVVYSIRHLAQRDLTPDDF